MAIYRDALNNIIDTQGTSQPSSAQNIFIDPSATSATLNAGATTTTDFKYNDPTTGNLVADRS